jgi:hypothetical protein
MVRLRRIAWSFLVVVALAPSTAAMSAKLPYPSSMAALGNSLTLAHATPGETLNSWATGTNPRVDSHYLRILGANCCDQGPRVQFGEFGASFCPLSPGRLGVSPSPAAADPVESTVERGRLARGVLPIPAWIVRSEAPRVGLEPTTLRLTGRSSGITAGP